nr:hypothetical protein BaRGS_019686 [Batillaria attramentaria]
MEENALRLMEEYRAVRNERHSLLSDELEAEKERRRLLAARERLEKEMQIMLSFIDESQKGKLEEMLRGGQTSKAQEDQPDDSS